MTASKTIRSVAALAAAMAITQLAAAPAVAEDAKDAKVHCYGVNSCKGQSDCKAGKHECKGMNACKGQGFKELSAKACTEQHGSTMPPKG